MLGFVRRWFDRRRCRKMGLKGLSVGTRFDGTLDVDIECNGEEGWNTSNLSLSEAEFLHEELGRAIARQKERGFPKPDPEPAPQLPAPEATPPAS